MNGDLVGLIGIQIGTVEYYEPEINYSEMINEYGEVSTDPLDYTRKIHAMEQWENMDYDDFGNPVRKDWSEGSGIPIDFEKLKSSIKDLWNELGRKIKEASEWPFPFDPFGMPRDEDPNNPFDIPADVDPIILDLSKNGIQTTRVDASVYFDYDGNGFAESTGWITGGDGLLVMDRNGNGNGSIDDGKELFGDQTILANGTKAVNGFEALAEWDKNCDNRIDAKDAVWVDDGKLKMLEELGMSNNICTQQSI